MTRAVRRIALETLGWILLLAGLAAIFLPGPGLLGMFAGLALLSRQYDWAQRRVEPVRLQAMKGAADGVATRFRVVVSCLGAVLLAVAGVVWIWQPPAPPWWPLDATWWLPGGLWTGVTQIASAIIALALIVYSYRRFHGQPDEVAALEREMARYRRRRREDRPVS